MRICLASALLTGTLALAAHAEPVKRTRYPALSPDGKIIAFSYQGDLWTVPAEGGRATRVTSHLARDLQPVFSPDGKSLVFASNRFGNYDLFLMPATGGQATRLTFHSGSDYPSAFTPDGKWVLFYSTAYGSADVYKVRTTGGEPIRLSWDDREREFFGSVSPDGQTLVYNHNGSPGSWRRRGYEGSNNADVWLARFTAPLSEPKRITTNPGQDFQPQFSRDGKRIFYVSDRKGQVNIWSMDLAGGAQKQHTFHTTDGARVPNLALRADRLVYEYDSEIWLLDIGSNKSARVNIDITTEERRNTVAERTVTTSPSEFSISPDGKKVALIVRGDLFVVPATGGLARKLVGRPGRESHVGWMPDSKTVLFVTDEKGQKDLHSIDISGQNEKVLAATPEDETNAVPSPDGNWIGFHLGDKAIAVIPAAGGGVSTTIRGDFPDISRNYGARFSWSANNRLLAFKSTGATLEDSVWVAELTDPQPKRVSRFFRDIGTPRWSANGKLLYFTAMAVDTSNLYAIDLAEDAPPEFEEDNIERLDRPQPQPVGAAPAQYDWSDAEKRLRRVTSAGGVVDAMLLPSSRTFLVQTGDDLQVIGADVRNGTGTTLVDGVNGIELPADGSRVYFFSGGQVQSVGLQLRDRRPTPFTATVSVDTAAENRQIFQEAWWMMDRYFYSENHNAVDWRGVRSKYEALLPYVAAYKEDFYELMAEMVQELRGSHLGITGPSEYAPETPSATAYLGIEPDWETLDREGKIKVGRVIPRSPADNKWTRLNPGDYILAVNGQDLDGEHTLDALLDRKAGRKVVLTVNTRPTPDGARQVAIKPITQADGSDLEYEAWVDARREMVRKLSNGRLAYLHVKEMNVPSEMRFKEELVGEATGRDGMLLDVRYNGGGNVAHRLLDILRKKPYVTFKPRSLGKTVLADWPMDYLWGKPAALLVNQDSASNSEMMAEGFKALGVGPVVGVPTMGAVIATGNWPLIDGGSLRTPHSGVYTAAGEDLELRGRQPDVLVPYDPMAAKEGRDPQLEKAVQTLLAKLPASQAAK